MMRALMIRLAIAAIVAVPAGAADAKPKARVNGCNQAQLQTPGAGQCLESIVGDMTSGKSYTHVVYCDSGGHILCCLQDNQTGATLDASCETLALRAHPEALSPKTRNNLLTSP